MRAIALLLCTMTMTACEADGAAAGQPAPPHGALCCGPTLDCLGLCPSEATDPDCLARCQAQAAPGVIGPLDVLYTCLDTACSRAFAPDHLLDLHTGCVQRALGNRPMEGCWPEPVPCGDCALAWKLCRAAPCTWAAADMGGH